MHKAHHEKYSFSFIVTRLHAYISAMHYLKRLFSAEAREKAHIKQALGLDVTSKHAAIVGKDAIKDAFFLEHLAALIKNIEQNNVHRNTEDSGLVMYTQDGKRICILSRSNVHYAFSVDQAPKKEITVCDQHSYTFTQEKAFFIENARKIDEITPEMVKKFEGFLSLIAINLKIEDLKKEKIDPKEKLSVLKQLMQEREDLLYKQV
jgi:hypothetical protein